MMTLIALLTIMNLHTPKFEIGECFSYSYSGNEFEPPSQSVVIRKVLKRGQYGYLVELDYKPEPEYLYYYEVDGGRYDKVKCEGPLKWEEK